MCSRVQFNENGFIVWLRRCEYMIKEVHDNVWNGRSTLFLCLVAFNCCIKWWTCNAQFGHSVSPIDTAVTPPMSVWHFSFLTTLGNVVDLSSVWSKSISKFTVFSSILRIMRSLGGMGPVATLRLCSVCAMIVEVFCSVAVELSLSKSCPCVLASWFVLLSSWMWIRVEDVAGKSCVWADVEFRRRNMYFFLAGWWVDVSESVESTLWEFSLANSSKVLFCGLYGRPVY